MSNVVERDIAHITSLQNIDLGSQHRVTNKSAECLIDRLIPRSKDGYNTVNCATSMVTNRRIEQEGKIIALDPKKSMML